MDVPVWVVFELCFFGLYCRIIVLYLSLTSGLLLWALNDLHLASIVKKIINNKLTIITIAEISLKVSALMVFKFDISQN